MEEFQTQGFLIKDGQHYVPRVLLYERTIPYISRVSLLAQELSSLSEQLHTLVQEVLAQEK